MDVRNKLLVGVVSATLISSTALWEGDKRDPYWDLAGILTVCSGHTGSDIIKGKRYTKEECTTLLQRDLVVHRQGVYKCVNAPMTPKQFDAFTMFTYNVGVSSFCKSTLLKDFNAGNPAKACDGLLKWSYVNGKFVQGLRNRREYERKMCLSE